MAKAHSQHNPNPPNPKNREIILARLTQGPALRSDIKRLTGLKNPSIASAISRLRDEQFDIITRGNGDPRYELLSGPQSLGPSFVCPSCGHVIPLNTEGAHTQGCKLGLAEDLLNGASL